jgi:hypothetical protein
VAGLTIIRAKYRPFHGRYGRSRQRRGFGFDHPKRVVFDTLSAFDSIRARRPVVAIEARPIVSAVAGRPFLPGTIGLAPIGGGPLRKGAVVLRPLLPGLFVTRPLSLAILVTPALPAFKAGLTFAAGIAGFDGVRFHFGLAALARATLILEIDVVSGHELVAADNLGERPLGLHGPHQPEVVFGVLEVVFRKHAITGSLGVTGQLLIFFIDVLRRAADLHALGTIGVKSAVGVVLGLTAATTTAATTAIAVAAALPLHSLEISHVFNLLTIFQRQWSPNEGPHVARP